MEFHYSSPGHEAKRGFTTLTPVNSNPNIWQSEKDFIVDGKKSLKISTSGANKQWVRCFSTNCMVVIKFHFSFTVVLSEPKTESI